MTLDRRTATIARILTALIRSPLPGTQFQVLADHVGQLLPCDFLAVCLVHPEREGYLLHALRGEAGNAIPQRLFTLDEGIVGKVICSREPYVTDNLADDGHGVPDLEGICSRLGLQSAMSAPLQQEGSAMGALLLATHEAAAYDSEDLEVCRLLASGLSEALESARVYQKMSDEHSMLEAVLRSSQDAVLLVNTQGTILMANPAVREIMGVETTKIVGQSLQQAIDNSTLIHLFVDNQVGIVEVPLSEGRTAQASLVPVTTSYSEPVGWAAILRDVTVFKELEQLKNDFVNTVSHDLKNPIGSLLMSVDLIGQAGTLNDKQKLIQERLETTAKYMDELVGDLLALGKIETGLNRETESLDVAELLDAVLETLRPQIEAKDLRLQCDVAAATFIVRGDRRLLRHALGNLVGNAVKYTPEGGQIEVSVMDAGQQDKPGGLEEERERAESGIVVAVRDTGIGIPSSDLPYIFDKFYRVQSDEMEQIEGTGLGLAIVKSAIEAHNGYVWARSEVGKGSTLAFYLPTSST